METRHRVVSVPTVYDQWECPVCGGPGWSEERGMVGHWGECGACGTVWRWFEVFGMTLFEGRVPVGAVWAFDAGSLPEEVSLSSFGPCRE